MFPSVTCKLLQVYHSVLRSTECFRYTSSYFSLGTPRHMFFILVRSHFICGYGQFISLCGTNALSIRKLEQADRFTPKHNSKSDRIIRTHIRYIFDGDFVLNRDWSAALASLGSFRSSWTSQSFKHTQPPDFLKLKVSRFPLRMASAFHLSISAVWSSLHIATITGSARLDF